MKLTDFDRHVLNQSGNPKELMEELYNKKVSLRHAESCMAGIRAHLNHKLAHANDDEIAKQLNTLSEVYTTKTGSVTTKRLILMSEQDSKNPKRIMELMGFDPVQWELEWCKAQMNYWDVTIKNLAWQPQKETNHAYKCELKVSPIQNVLSTQMIRDIFTDLKPPKIDPIHKQKLPGRLLELQIVDVHLGLLAWGKETEDTDYDINIATDRVKHVINTFLQDLKTYNMKIARIELPLGQDFFHFDSELNTTTKGTPLDTDSRWQKMYKTGIDLLIWMVESLRQLAPVRCSYVASNHDKMLSFCAANHLEGYYRACPDVIVDAIPTPRKYIRYGKCFIGLAHGDEEGKRIKDIMQVERKKDWGETTYREWHLAHLHSEHVEEVGGVLIRHLPPIVPKDSWHKEKGYVGSLSKAKAFIWDEEKGNVATLTVNLN